MRVAMESLSRQHPIVSPQTDAGRASISSVYIHSRSRLCRPVLSRMHLPCRYTVEFSLSPRPRLRGQIARYISVRREAQGKKEVQGASLKLWVLWYCSGVSPLMLTDCRPRTVSILSLFAHDVALWGFSGLFSSPMRPPRLTNAGPT